MPDTCQTYIPRYLGVRDEEDSGLRPVQEEFSRPHLNQCHSSYAGSINRIMVQGGLGINVGHLSKNN
jgi:hypothetical protein